MGDTGACVHCLIIGQIGGIPGPLLRPADIVRPFEVEYGGQDDLSVLRPVADFIVSQIRIPRLVPDIPFRLLLHRADGLKKTLETKHIRPAHLPQSAACSKQCRGKSHQQKKQHRSHRCPAQSEQAFLYDSHFLSFLGSSSLLTALNRRRPALPSRSGHGTTTAPPRSPQERTGKIRRLKTGAPQRSPSLSEEPAG